MAERRRIVWNGTYIKQGLDVQNQVRANLILRGMPSETLAELLDNAELVYFDRGDRLDHWVSRGYVIFPLSGIHGGLLETEDGECIQPVFVGSEGVIGGMRALHRMPFFFSFKVRLPGEAVVLPAAIFRQIAEREPALRVALTYAYDSKFHLSAMHAVCARFHPLSVRCCAWLSLIYNETEDDIVPITHEELAEVVGATRPAVSAALSLFDQARIGLLDSARRAPPARSGTGRATRLLMLDDRGTSPGRVRRIVGAVTPPNLPLPSGGRSPLPTRGGAGRGGPATTFSL